VAEEPPVTSDNTDDTAADLAREIRRRRKDAKLSQPQLAKRIGYTHQYVSLAERIGQNLPSQELVRALDAALNAEGALLALRDQAKAEQHARRHTSDASPTSLCQESSTPDRHAVIARVEKSSTRTLRKIQLNSPDLANQQYSDEVATEIPGWRILGHVEILTSCEEDDMRRRILFGLPVVPLLGGFLSSAEPVRRSVDAALSFPSTEHDVTEGERVADGYARLVHQVPAERFLPQLLLDLDEFQGRIESAGNDLKPRLARVCALLSGVAAISLQGAGYWPEADRYWRMAHRAAAYSGDSVLNSLISGRRAVLGMYSPGRPRSSTLSLADDALAMGADNPSAGTASGWAARAQVLALHGDRSGARDALSRLETEFELLPEATRTDTTTPWGWSEHRLFHVQSFMHSYTGDPREAGKAQDTVLSLYSPSSRGAAQVRFHQAACMIVSGDPSQGARHIVEVFESIPPGFRNGDLKSAAAFALEKLPDHAERIPAVRQVRELMGSATYI